MLEKNIINQVIEFAEGSKKLIGKKLTLKEYISTNKDNFDRHFTTYSNFSFILINFGIRISGGKMMFGGEFFNYEISSYHLIEFEEKEETYIFMEKLSENIYRRSELKFNN